MATVTPIRPVHHHQTGMTRDQATGKYVVVCACGFRSAPCDSETRAAARWNVHLLAVQLEQRAGS